MDLDAVAYNFEAMHKNIKPGTKMIAVVKADAYGHGAVPIARLVQDYDYIWGFAVATEEEALPLREAGIRKPILVLGLVFPECMEELAKNDISIAVSSISLARGSAKAGRKLSKTVKIHLAVDTGMTRIGFHDGSQSLEEIKNISKLPYLEIEGMFTHFARADEYDVSPAKTQLDRFLAFASLLEENGIHIPMKHCSNSAGLIRMQEANLDAVRAGITIYGVYPSQQVEKHIVELKPVMELKSHVSFVKEDHKGNGRKLWRHLYCTKGYAAGHHPGRICRWIFQAAIRKRLGADPWEKGTYLRKSLHGSVYGRCYRDSGSKNR